MKIGNLVVALLAVLAAACDDERGSPATAKGDTPIRYVICSVGDKDCFVAARFTDFSACERHKEWSGMVCDRNKPGRMVCNTPESTESVGYCTK